MMREMDPMAYLPDMEAIPEDIMNRVLTSRAAYNEGAFSGADVERALQSDRLSADGFAALLSPAARPYLEEMVRRATEETRRHFGNSVYLFTPLYLSNYCENHCVYCGFNCRHQIRRMKLDPQRMEEELRAIADTGLEEILLLTGESPAASDVEYIAAACAMARRHFKMVGVEVYPMDSREYAHLHESGADFVTVFQETYDPIRYGELHLAGRKRSFPYRFHAQERALRGGMRGVAFGALLGLADCRRDAFATGLHAHLIQRKYPYAEISISCPRLCPAETEESIDPQLIGEEELLQIMAAYRLFLPYANLTISTRERAQFRDQVIGRMATKISAGVSTGIGSHVSGEDTGDEQFEIFDSRTVAEVTIAIQSRGLEAVRNEYVYL